MAEKQDEDEDEGESIAGGINCCKRYDFINIFEKLFGLTQTKCSW